MAPAKTKSDFSEGDAITMSGEVSRLHEDGRVTVWLTGYGLPLTTRGEHLTLVTKAKAKAKAPKKRGKQLFDKPD